MKNSEKNLNQREILRSIDLRIAHRLKDREFRREWFLAELETTVPQLFRTLREKRKLTQTQLSELTGMKQSAISRFEISTDAKWNFETLQTMAGALDGRLYIGLEPAEDVIKRVEREEKQASVNRRSAADSSAAQNLNKEKSNEEGSAATHTTPKLNDLKPMSKGENRPWN